MRSWKEMEEESKAKRRVRWADFLMGGFLCSLAAVMGVAATVLLLNLFPAARFVEGPDELDLSEAIGYSIQASEHFRFENPTRIQLIDVTLTCTSFDVLRGERSKVIFHCVEE